MHLLAAYGSRDASSCLPKDIAANRECCERRAGSALSNSDAGLQQEQWARTSDLLKNPSSPSLASDAVESAPTETEEAEALAGAAVAATRRTAAEHLTKTPRRDGASRT